MAMPLIGTSLMPVVLAMILSNPLQVRSEDCIIYDNLDPFEFRMGSDVDELKEIAIEAFSTFLSKHVDPTRLCGLLGHTYNSEMDPFDFGVTGFDRIPYHYRSGLTLAVGAVLRQNLIRVFGYILHRHEMSLNTDLYTSLYFIQTALKLNTVDILSLVPFLYDISFETSNRRFLEIFRLLKEFLPLYLKCSAALWIDSLEEEIVNLDSIILPYENGHLLVDVFQNLKPKVLFAVSTNRGLNRSSLITRGLTRQCLSEEEEEILDKYDNINFVYMTRVIKAFINKPMPPFIVGAILQFFPRLGHDALLEESVNPSFEESILFLDQYLREECFDEEVFQKINQHYCQEPDPFTFVNYYLKQAYQVSPSKRILNEVIRVVLQAIQALRPKTVKDGYAFNVSSVPLKKELKYTDLLDYVNAGHFSIDVAIASQRLKYYLEQGHVPLCVFEDFPYFLYFSKTETLIAILYRILQREPNLPDEIIASVGVVYSNLLFMYRFRLFPVVISDDLSDINTAVMSTKSPDILASVAEAIKRINDFVGSEGPLYRTLLRLRIIEPYECSVPLTCFSAFILKVNGRRVEDDPLLAKEVESFLDSGCSVGKCPVTRMQSNTNIIPSDVFQRIWNEVSYSEPPPSDLPSAHSSLLSPAPIAVPHFKPLLPPPPPPPLPLPPLRPPSLDFPPPPPSFPFPPPPPMPHLPPPPFLRPPPPPISSPSLPPRHPSPTSRPTSSRHKSPRPTSVSSTSPSHLSSPVVVSRFHHPLPPLPPSPLHPLLPPPLPPPPPHLDSLPPPPHLDPLPPPPDLGPLPPPSHLDDFPLPPPLPMPPPIAHLPPPHLLPSPPSSISRPLHLPPTSPRPTSSRPASSRPTLALSTSVSPSSAS